MHGLIKHGILACVAKLVEAVAELVRLECVKALMFKQRGKIEAKLRN